MNGFCIFVFCNLITNNYNSNIFSTEVVSQSQHTKYFAIMLSQNDNWCISAIFIVIILVIIIIISIIIVVVVVITVLFIIISSIFAIHVVILILVLRVQHIFINYDM